MNFKIACCILVYVIISLVQSKSLSAKHKNKHASKVIKEPKKRVSTQQKIGSGHAKGPMANNVQSSVPLPVVMPFPMIPFDDRYPIIFKPNGKPKKGREKKKDPKGETEDETDKDVDDDSDDGDKQYKGLGKINKGPYLKDGPRLMKNAAKEPAKESAEDEDSVETAKGDNLSSDQDSDKDDDNEEESKLTEKKKRKTSHLKQNSSKKEISRERRAIYKPIIGNPEDIMPYIMWGSEEEEFLDDADAHKMVTRNAEEEQLDNNLHGDYDEPLDIRRRDVDDTQEDEEDAQEEDDGDDETHVINTRDVTEEEGEEEEEEDEARDMKPRSLPDEGPDMETAERKMKDVKKAADVLTQIQKALGANPENSVEETHALADVLRKDMETYDEEIAKDIIATQNAQTRSKIIVSDDGEKGNNELTNAKRKLQNDRAKEEEIRNELKEIKDIELMTTQLELAKYLATENVRHQVQFAEALHRTHVESTPQTTQYQTSYAPTTYQQPGSYVQQASYVQPTSNSYSYTPAIQEMSMPAPPPSAVVQHVFPQAINYAFSPNNAKAGNYRYELANVEKGGNQFGSRQQTPSYYSNQRETTRLPKTSYAQGPRFQAAIEAPKPSMAVHTDAQSRHVTKPTVTKPKQGWNRRPNILSRFYPTKVKPYGQAKTTSMNRERPSASLVGRKPSLSFPGPTYSPPPFTTRTDSPRNPYINRYRAKYVKPKVTKRPKNPALASFFNYQQHANPMGNLYHSQGFNAQQHMPLYTHETYKAPVVKPEPYHIGEFHSIEREQPHFNVHSPFIGDVSHPFNSYQAPEYTASAVEQQKQSAAKTQVPAFHTQYTVAPATDYMSGVPFQYALPRPQGPSFGAPSPVVYQVPTSFSESFAASKGDIPSFYAPYYSTPPPAAPQLQSYAQTARPFEAMNTDSEVFHGSSPPQQNTNQAAPQTKVQNPEKVPLGYGLFPLPDNAEKKMDEDAEEQKLDHNIKADTKGLQETKDAATAVTKIENQVGFDPGSIAKLVDFVKQAAEKDVELSERAMKRDQTTIKKMEIEHANSRKSEIGTENSIAMKEAQQKLKIDTELLNESKDRLDKVKRMELIVTGIEAAKYSALSRRQGKLANDVNAMNQYKASKKTVVGRKGFERYGKRSS